VELPNLDVRPTGKSSSPALSRKAARRRKLRPLQAVPGVCLTAIELSVRSVLNGDLLTRSCVPSQWSSHINRNSRRLECLILCHRGGSYESLLSNYESNLRNHGKGVCVMKNDEHLTRLPDENGSVL